MPSEVPVAPLAFSPPEQVPELLPLTAAQAGLWYAQRLQPTNPVFNTGQLVHLRGDLNLEAFRTAVEQVMREADALHIRVVETGDGPLQLPDPALIPKLDIVDLRSEADAEARARRWADRDMRSPLDLTRGPVAVQRLFRLADDRHIWYQRIHHLAIDGYGTHLVNSRIADLYSAAVTGATPRTLPFKGLAELIASEERYHSGARREADRDFWMREFADRPDVAGLKAGQALTAHSYLRATGDVPAAIADRLRALAENASVAWPDALVALIIAYLDRHLPRSELVAGVTAMNRLGGVEAKVPAMVMNILPVRVPRAAGATATHLRTVADHLRQARRHGRYRSEQLRQDLGLLGSNRRLFGPLINVIPFDETPAFTRLDSAIELLGTGPVDDLTVEARAGANGQAIRLELQANPDLYSQAEIDAHLARLISWLDRTSVSDNLSEVGTLSPAEYERWVEEVNRTQRTVEDVTLTDLIERTMREAPERTALVFEGRSLTYAELEEWSGRVAAELRDAGIGPGDFVAVSIPRSFELVVTLVGILRAGAAYLPVDPEAPRERTARMFVTAHPKLGFTASTGDELPCVVRRVIGPFEPVCSVLAAERQAAGIAPAARPTDPAYVIYTSGSTGEPKGVLVEHRAIVNRLEWMREAYDIRSDDRILQKTPATFDVSVWEFFLPLIAGATLVIAAPGAHRDPGAIEAVMRSEEITTLHFVPSMLGVFLEHVSGPIPSLKRVFCSGEALPASLRDRFHRCLQAALHNLYGPTEAAVDVSYWEAGPDDESDPVPIGRPVWNTRLYVLDEELRPLPPGVVGELFLGGVQLARGYVGRSELTAERFLPDPLGGPGDRMYRTGDLADWREDGVVVYRGRTDHQIKLRGFRIELGEIESAIAEAENVAQTAVVPRDDLPGTTRLVAYIVPRDMERAPDEQEVRRRLRDALPDYMVPSDIVFLDALPLTRNGKLDREALPAPPRPDGPSDDDLPSGPYEKKISDLFAEVLQLPRVGAGDDFFLLGGHSLLAARLATRLRDVLGEDVGLGAIFSHPTVRELAAHLESAASGNAGGLRKGLEPLLRLREGGDGPPIFCIHPAGGIAWSYRALASALPDRNPVFGIQSRGLDLAAELPSTLDQMAADYADLVVAASGNRTVHLVGWSVGGIIAQTMAVELRRRGIEPGIVALLDAYPSDVWRDQPEPTEADALGALLQIAGHSDATESPEERTRAGVIATLRRLGHPLGELSDDELTGVVRVVEQNARLVRRHRHDIFNGELTHFRAVLDHVDSGLSPSMWSPYAREVTTFDIETTHPRMVTGEAVRRIAALLTPALQGQGG